jgi:acyl carrier protein
MTYNNVAEIRRNYNVIFERIKEMIVEELNVPVEKITMAARLAEDLGADSIDAVELIMNIEDEFKIQVSDESAQNMKTVGDLVRYIESVK